MPAIIDGTNTSTFPGVDGVTMLEGGIAMPRMVLATAQNTTSGTSIDFTSIPSWVKRITFIGAAVSTTGTSAIIIRTGSGSFVSSGYRITQSAFSVASIATVNSTSTTAFDVTSGSAAAGTYNFKATLDLIGSNVYVYTCMSGRDDGAAGWFEAGSITLSGALDRLRLTTVGGTDTFDAGSVNILYEG